MGKTPYVSQLNQLANGHLFVYSAPVSVVSHLQWSIESLVTLAAPWRWQPQVLIPKSQQIQLPFRSSLDKFPALVSRLLEFPNLYAEVIREPIGFGLGERWLLTPNLGLKRVEINEFGDAVVSENQINHLIEQSADLATGLIELIGRSWDLELEPLRIASSEANARLLAAGG